MEEAKGEVKVMKEAKGEVKVTKEAKGEVKVAVPIKDFWKAMPTGFLHLVPKLSPDFVNEVELVEGENGHVGCVIKYKFHPNIPYGTHQTEKLIEVDESLHQLVFKVVEGGALNHGFCSYMGCFKLSEVSEAETRAEMIVTYEKEEEDTLLPEESVKGGLLISKSSKTIC